MWHSFVKALSSEGSRGCSATCVAIRCVCSSEQRDHHDARIFAGLSASEGCFLFLFPPRHKLRNEQRGQAENDFVVSGHVSMKKKKHWKHRLDLPLLHRKKSNREILWLGLRSGRKGADHFSGSMACGPSACAEPALSGNGDLLPHSFTRPALSKSGSRRESAGNQPLADKTPFPCGADLARKPEIDLQSRLENAGGCHLRGGVSVVFTISFLGRIKPKVSSNPAWQIPPRPRSTPSRKLMLRKLRN